MLLTKATITSIVFITSFFATFIMIRIAKHHKIIDIPNARSSHSNPTPRGGGMAIAISWFISLVFAYYMHYIDKDFLCALLSGLILVVIGFIDDIKNISSGIRMILQIITAIIGLYFLGGLRFISLGFASVDLAVFTNVFTMLFILWMINLFNFLDGIDGYLGIEAVFLFLALFFFTGDFLALLFVVSILGFLIWNWPKSKIFSGDVGSTLVGYTFVVFAIYYQNSNKLSLINSIILSMVFLFDATVTLYRRWKNHEKLSTAHKKHAYQRLYQAGIAVPAILLIATGFNLFLFLNAYLSNRYEWFLLPGLIIALLTGYVFMRIADRKKPFSFNENEK